MLQTRGDVKICLGKEAEGEEYSPLEEIVRMLALEFSEKLPEPPLLSLARPVGLITSLARGSSEHSDPSILASHLNTPGNTHSLNETFAQDSTLMDSSLQVIEENESFSFLQSQNIDPGVQVHSSLFATDITLNRVLEQLEKEEHSMSLIPEEQDLDSVPIQPLMSPIQRRVSESILTHVSRKPPVYPKQPSNPRPMFTRKASGLSRTKSLKNLEDTMEKIPPDPVVFLMTSRQLEHYAMEYHRPRRTGLIYTMQDDS